jgi:hypothetical protein
MLAIDGQELLDLFRGWRGRLARIGEVQETQYEFDLLPRLGGDGLGFH